MTLPAYLALGAIWRISVLIGHPLNEADNKKWRKRILLVLFLPTTVIGMIFGIVGMGKAAHFSTGHGVRPAMFPQSPKTDVITGSWSYYLYLAGSYDCDQRPTP